MISMILHFILWFCVWLALSWPPEGPQVMMAGALAALFVTFIVVDTLGDTYTEPSGRRVGIIGLFTRIPWFVYYSVVFIWECIKANIDVAFRVIHPDLPIRPGNVKIKTSLKSDVALTFLANSITLTPGTTTVDIDKESGYIYIHWLFVWNDYDKATQTLPVVEKFEKILKRIFE